MPVPRGELEGEGQGEEVVDDGCYVATIRDGEGAVLVSRK